VDSGRGFGVGDFELRIDWDTGKGWSSKTQPEFKSKRGGELQGNVKQAGCGRVDSGILMCWKDHRARLL